VAVGLYIGIPRVLTYMMVLDEQSKAKAKFAESLIPNTSTEVEVTSGVKKMPLGASMGGGGGTVAGGEPKPATSPTPTPSENEPTKE
jgi:hypothetical protein